MEPSISYSNVFHQCAAGGMAAAIGRTTTAPIDRIKLVLQLQQPGPSNVVIHSGIRDCMKKICTEQGWLSLWRGNCAGVARCFPQNAMNFALRDFYRNIFLAGVDRQRDLKRFMMGSLLSGGLGGATSQIVLYPFDFARTRLAVDAKSDGSKRFRGMVHCLQEIRKKDGMLAWYRGLSASLQFVVASRALFFGFFDTIRNGYRSPKDVNFFVTWITAQVCLTSSGFVTYPLDTVRRRLMMEAGKVEKVYRNTMNCWKTIKRREGVQGFYRGCMANCVRSTGGALVISLYYEFNKYMS